MLSRRVLARVLGMDAKSVRMENVELVDDELEIRVRPRIRHRWRCPHCEVGTAPSSVDISNVRKPLTGRMSHAKALPARVPA